MINDGIIEDTETGGISVGEVSSVIGIGSLDVATLCRGGYTPETDTPEIKHTSTNIKLWSRHKPIRYDGVYTKLTDLQWHNANYGINMENSLQSKSPYCMGGLLDVIAKVKATKCQWDDIACWDYPGSGKNADGTYTNPPIYRLLDFDGYCTFAEPFCKIVKPKETAIVLSNDYYPSINIKNVMQSKPIAYTVQTKDELDKLHSNTSVYNSLKVGDIINVVSDETNNHISTCYKLTNKSGNGTYVKDPHAFYNIRISDLIDANGARLNEDYYFGVLYEDEQQYKLLTEGTFIPYNSGGPGSHITLAKIPVKNFQHNNDEVLFNIPINIGHQMGLKSYSGYVGLFHKDTLDALALEGPENIESIEFRSIFLPDGLLNFNVKRSKIKLVFSVISSDGGTPVYCFSGSSDNKNVFVGITPPSYYRVRVDIDQTDPDTAQILKDNPGITELDINAQVKLNYYFGTGSGPDSDIFKFPSSSIEEEYMEGGTVNESRFSCKLVKVTDPNTKIETWELKDNAGTTVDGIYLTGFPYKTLFPGSDQSVSGSIYVEGNPYNISYNDILKWRERINKYTYVTSYLIAEAWFPESKETNYWIDTAESSSKSWTCRQLIR